MFSSASAVFFLRNIAHYSESGTNCVEYSESGTNCVEMVCVVKKLYACCYVKSVFHPLEVWGCIYGAEIHSVSKMAVDLQ
jgi:hypothetical protein